MVEQSVSKLTHLVCKRCHRYIEAFEHEIHEDAVKVRCHFDTLNCKIWKK
ncbi:hypothetical protein ACFLRC_03470 [Candidatus Altiarchaeota archaeon]